jgi:hypothetical protein
VYFCYCNGATPFLSKNRFYSNKASTFNGQIGVYSSLPPASCSMLTFCCNTATAISSACPTQLLHAAAFADVWDSGAAERHSHVRPLSLPVKQAALDCINKTYV